MKNPNTPYDESLLEEMDHLLQTGRPSGRAPLDELARSRPRAKQAFQQRLEAELILEMKRKAAQMPQKSKREFGNPPFFLSVPMTLAAAAVMLIIGGLMMLVFPRQPQMPPMAAPVNLGYELTATTFIRQATQTAGAAMMSTEMMSTAAVIDSHFLTATAIVALATQMSSPPILTPPPNTLQVVNIVVANAEIAAGESIQPQQLRLQAYLLDYAPQTAAIYPEDIVGKLSSGTILAGQPITLDRLEINDVAPIRTIAGQPDDATQRYEVANMRADTLLPILTVRVDLPAGTRLQPHHLGFVMWPRAIVPAEALDNMETALGRVTRLPLSPQSLVLESYLDAEQIGWP